MKNKSSITTSIFIILGIVIYIAFGFFIKHTNFLEILTGWKRLWFIPLAPLSILLGIAVPVLVGNLIKNKLENWGMFKEKADNIAFVLVFIIMGLWFLWIK